MQLRFFPSPSQFRVWLERHHAHSKELWVGFYKRDSRRPSVTWPEAVGQAFCFGWIDGVRKRIDDLRYTIRFTPRKPRSRWSAVNIKRAKELVEEGLMSSAGLEAFARRPQNREAIYSYERRKSARLTAADQRKFAANQQAWSFFQGQPPWYRRTASWWVLSAKKQETRSKRLATLIECSEQQRTIPPLTRPSRKK